VTDERLLIERAKQGDMEAFHELVEFSKINVYRLAYDMVRNRHDAEDVSQDVFLQAYRSLPAFRGDAKWGTWLYRITVNTCLDRNKSMTRKAVEFRDDIGSDGAHEASRRPHDGVQPDRSADSTIIQEHIERALETLSSQERTVFVLRHYHDLPLKQIAETLSVAEGTVKSYLFRAVHRLQKELAFYKSDLGLEHKL
jgi:RNA polymerase sigma-70 factor (ECF subfamily)